MPDAGDYVVRRVVDDSFIVVRDEAGTVRVHFNMCLHRGMQICRAEVGNASHFRCPYHGWSYRNDGRLAASPSTRTPTAATPSCARASTVCCRPQGGVDNGLIFVSLDPAAPPLRDYLGVFHFYLDYYTRQSPGGVELHGPQRWRIKANWKIARRELRR